MSFDLDSGASSGGNFLSSTKLLPRRVVDFAAIPTTATATQKKQSSTSYKTILDAYPVGDVVSIDYSSANTWETIVDESVEGLLGAIVSPTKSGGMTVEFEITLDGVVETYTQVLLDYEAFVLGSTVGDTTYGSSDGFKAARTAMVDRVDSMVSRGAPVVHYLESLKVRMRMSGTPQSGNSRSRCDVFRKNI